MINSRYIFNQLKYYMLFLLCIYTIVVRADPDFNPHNVVVGQNNIGEQCLSCHKSQSLINIKVMGKYALPDMSGFVKNETSMCQECHGDDNSSHIVGVTPDYTVPADLPLDKSNKITCLTCHYVHGSLESERPMASSSFMDHLFNRDRLKKSYVLRRNNAEGDMCLACHSKE